MQVALEGEHGRAARADISAEDQDCRRDGPEPVPIFDEATRRLSDSEVRDPILARPGAQLHEHVSGPNRWLLCTAPLRDVQQPGAGRWVAAEF